MVDSHLRGFQLDGADVITARAPSDGLWSMAKLLRRGCFDLTSCKVLFVFLGRADVGDDILDAVEDFSATVGRCNYNIALVISGPIPRFGDSRRMVGACVLAGRKIKNLCTRIQRLQFSNVAAQFYNKAGVNPATLHKFGITQAGSSILASNVMAKLKSTAIIAQAGTIVL